jgi:Leucine-rich repeat (LRR) protein
MPGQRTYPRQWTAARRLERVPKPVTVNRLDGSVSHSLETPLKTLPKALLGRVILFLSRDEGWRLALVCRLLFAAHAWHIQHGLQNPGRLRVPDLRPEDALVNELRGLRHRLGSRPAPGMTWTVVVRTGKSGKLDNRAALLTEIRRVGMIAAVHLSPCTGQVATDVSMLHACLGESLVELTSDFDESLLLSDGLKQLSSLTALHLYVCDDLSSTAPLARLSALTSLKLFRCSSLVVADTLGNLVELRTLALLGCHGLTTIDALGGLVRLQALCLGDCPKVKSVSVLRQLTSLTSLELSNFSCVSDCECIGGLINLGSLRIESCAALTSLAALASLGKLHTIEISGCSCSQSLPSLSKLQSLRTLKVTGSQLTDATALGALQQLVTLDLSRSAELCSVRALDSLTGLCSLNLSWCAKLTEFCELSGLRHLNIHGCNTHWQPVRLLFSNLQSLYWQGQNRVSRCSW